jgi:hypothetical protein
MSQVQVTDGIFQSIGCDRGQLQINADKSANKVTLWRRDLLGKLTVTQLDKEFLTFRVTQILSNPPQETATDLCSEPNTEQVPLAVTPCTCIWETLTLNLDRSTD